MSLVRYRRLSSAPPPERELLTVDLDGAWTGWRSRGPVVGRFAGRIADPDGLLALVERAAAADVPVASELPFDAAWERIEAGGLVLSVRAGADVPDPWGELASWCRSRIEAMAEDPAGAVSVVAGASAVRLEHRGQEVLPLELASLSVEIGWWRDGAQAGAATAGVPGLGRVEAGPGWSLEVPVAAMQATQGDTVVAWVRFVVDDRGVYVPVLATASRVLG